MIHTFRFNDENEDDRYKLDQCLDAQQMHRALDVFFTKVRGTLKYETPSKELSDYLERLREEIRDELESCRSSF